MKKSLFTIAILLLTLSITAQTSANRSQQTVIADALALLPADNKQEYDRIMQELTSTGEDGIRLLIGKLNTQKKGRNPAVEYALSGITHYVSGRGKENLCTIVANAYLKSLNGENTTTVETFINEQLRILGKGKTADTHISLSKNQRNDTQAGEKAARIYAVRTLLSSQKERGLKTLQVALKDHCREYRTAALDAFSPFAGKTSYKALLKTLLKARPNVKADIINWLSREALSPDKRALIFEVSTGKEALLRQLDDTDFDVKQATANALLALRDTQAIPALAKMLTDRDPKVIELGKSTLSATKADICTHIAGIIHTTTDLGRIATLELFAERKSTENLKTVLFSIQSGTPEVKAAACKALKDVVTEKDEETIAALMLSVSEKDVPAVRQAYMVTILPLPAAEQVNHLKRNMARSGNRKHLYYMPLAATGDPDALTVINEGFESADKDTRDAALNAMLNWSGSDAASLIFDICKNPAAIEYFDRAFETYVKKVSTLSLTGENRLIFLRKAMEIAKTDNQRNLILKHIGQTGTYLALLYAGEFLDQAALKENAAQAVMTVALNHKEYTGANVTALLEAAAAALSNPDADYQRQSIRKHLSELPQEKGFISIFNGKDLTGWQGMLAPPNDNPLKRATLNPAEYLQQQKEANILMHRDWIVENGLLAYIGHGYNNLCTKKKYGDFEMYVDWRLDPDGHDADAGIYLRGTPQVQIWDIARTNVGAQVGSGGLYNNRTNPDKPLKLADNKIGEWNTMHIKILGDRVTVNLNGQLVTDNTILENYWDRSLPLPSLEQIELQAHGSKVYYRNIYVKEFESLKPFELSSQEKEEGFRSLFDGISMDHWTGDTVNYQLEDGCISVRPKQSFGGNLYTKDEYSDFVFRFEFQLTPSANNGVGIRAPMEGDNAYNAMEIQILDSEHPVYADIKPYQHHGSVYGVIAAQHGAMKPVGEWNEEEIYANGDYIRVTLNGKVILDGNIREASKDGTLDGIDHPGLLNKSGHIGFLGHGSELKFRNIRIKELVSVHQ
ncbi:MAG: DUF1080 domain-containing protein [Dysgonamonadaceae bacterium]|jgi:HEAT repeat protein|nr:DUF1080 domain-containing protein [Dysgonamonadaceae bacterium]